MSCRSFRSGLFSNFTLLVDPAFEFADVSVGGGREMGIGRYEKAEVHMRDLALFSLQFNHTDIVTSLSPWNPTKERNLLQKFRSIS